MSRFAALVSKVDMSIEDHCCWSIQHMPFTVATSLEDDSPFSINLAETLGHNIRVSQKAESPRFWLQREYSFNTSQFRKETLAPMVARVCIQHGFTSINKGWDSQKNKVLFICSRGKYYQKKVTKAPHHQLKKRQQGGQQTGPYWMLIKKQRAPSGLQFTGAQTEKDGIFQSNRVEATLMWAMSGFSQNLLLFLPNQSQMMKRKKLP